MIDIDLLLFKLKYIIQGALLTSMIGPYIMKVLYNTNDEIYQQCLIGDLIVSSTPAVISILSIMIFFIFKAINWCRNYRRDLIENITIV
jgi:hypothetical protein